MKKILLIIIAISFSSCASYYDAKGNLDYDYMRLSIGADYNTLTTKDRLPGNADGQMYYPQKFEINLPKNISGWMISGNNYIFEFTNKQIIVIDAGYSNYKKKIVIVGY